MIGDNIWQPISRPELGLLNSISNLIHRIEIKQQNVLTPIRSGPSIILISDYGGQHKSAKYESYSFLLADLAYLWLWDEMRINIRCKYLADNRRMSFKNLNDLRKKKALIPFLRIANCIPGLIITVLIEKGIISPFFDPKADKLNDLDGFNCSLWKPKTFEKLLRIFYFGSLFFSGMSAPKQNLLWFTDQDDIASNDQQVIEGCKILAHITGVLSTHDFGHLKYGTTKCDNGDLMIEDLAAIPDLVAGALCELAPNFKVTAFPDTFHFALQGSPIKDNKSRIIMDWLSDPSQILKKLIIRIDNSNLGKVNMGCVHFSCLSRPTQFFWHEDYINVMKNKFVLHGS